MKKTIVSLAAIAATLAATPIQAQDAQTYTPDSAWALDFGEDYCRLGREFTNGSDRITLLLERTHPNANLRVILIGNSIRLFRGSNTVGWRFLPSGGERTGQKVVQETGNGQQYLNLGNAMLAEFPGFGAGPGGGGGPGAGGGFAGIVPGAPMYSREMERETAAGINGISLEGGVTNQIQLDTGSLARPIEAMQACADDMLTYWGLDAEVDKTLTRTVVPGDGTAPAPEPGQFPASPSQGWIAQNVVGFEDFAKLAGGGNMVRVMVDATGKATSCAVHLPALDAGTNATICEQVLANAKFQPALDANGQAIDSYWVTSPMALTPPFGGGRGRRR